MLGLELNLALVPALAAPWSFAEVPRASSVVHMTSGEGAEAPETISGSLRDMGPTRHLDASSQACPAMGGQR